nr:ras-related protein rab-2a [Quercus suber]
MSYLISDDKRTVDRLSTLRHPVFRLQAGQESFRSITRSYYRGAAGALLVYDITSLLGPATTSISQHQQNWPGRIISFILGRVLLQKGGEYVSRQLSQEEWMQAHLYVLKNCDEVLPYIEEHKYLIQQASVKNVENRHEKQFREWFECHITQLYDERKVSKQLFDLARGPLEEAELEGTHNG